MPFSTLDFRFPGVLNSKEMLVAEAIHARAWQAISDDLRIVGAPSNAAKTRLARIVTDLVARGPNPMGDLTAAAVRAFHDGRSDGEFT